MKDPRDIATFLTYGSDAADVDDEIRMDLFCGVSQRRRSMSYNRSFGCYPAENYPSGLSFAVGTRHEIASWIARRNSQVGDGTGGTVDRRCITSQNRITVVDDGRGAIQVDVSVIALHSPAAESTVTVPLGGA